ncbi:MAG: Mov34/MPN/PAD-1 family protein [Solirubrobacterales bacterium]
MLIARSLLDELIAHARADAPNECCGVLAVEPDRSKAGGTAPEGGGRARAVRVHRAVNTAASPLRFEVDGRELLRTIDEIEREGRELGAIYHSHTRTAPYPSQTDINFAANWPGVEWIIVGLAAGREPEVRSYLIDGANVQEVPIEEPPW